MIVLDFEHSEIRPKLALGNLSVHDRSLIAGSDMFKYILLLRATGKGILPRIVAKNS